MELCQGEVIFKDRFDFFVDEISTPLFRVISSVPPNQKLRCFRTLLIRHHQIFSNAEKRTTANIYIRCERQVSNASCPAKSPTSPARYSNGLPTNQPFHHSLSTDIAELSTYFLRELRLPLSWKATSATFSLDFELLMLDIPADR